MPPPAKLMRSGALALSSRFSTRCCSPHSPIGVGPPFLVVWRDPHGDEHAPQSVQDLPNNADCSLLLAYDDLAPRVPVYRSRAAGEPSLVEIKLLLVERSPARSGQGCQPGPRLDPCLEYGRRSAVGRRVTRTSDPGSTLSSAGSPNSPSAGCGAAATIPVRSSGISPPTRSSTASPSIVTGYLTQDTRRRSLSPYGSSRSCGQSP